MRRIAAALFVPFIAAAALAGCGSSATPPASPNGTVTAAGSFGHVPAVQIPSAKAGGNLFIKTEVQGSGAPLASTDSFLGNYAVYIWSGTTHRLLQSTFAATPQLLPARLLPGLQTALDGKRMGSRVLAVLPPKFGFGTAGNAQAGVAATDTLVWVIDMIRSYHGTTSASGAHVSDGGGALPAVATVPGSAPTVKIPVTAPPGTLVVKTLIKGSGAPVGKGQEVVVQYTGLNWRTRSVFDSSWSRGAPFGFLLGASPEQVISGWDQGLAGVPVGSRVMLIIPPRDGYGSAGQPGAGIKGTDTLVFVVDVLDAAS
jgi:peptidylprolyl isomerase